MVTKQDMQRGSRRGDWGNVRVERAPYNPDAHEIATYYNHDQRQRHDAARRAAMVEVRSGFKAIAWGVAAGLLIAAYLYFGV